jgi:hypothetical protein
MQNNSLPQNYEEFLNCKNPPSFFRESKKSRNHDQASQGVKAKVLRLHQK